MRVSKQIISIAPPALAGRISKNPCSNTSTLYNTIHITLKIIIYYNYIIPISYELIKQQSQILTHILV